MSLKVTTKAPIPFRIGKFMIRRGLPGGYRTLIVARRLGLLGSVVEYPLLDGYRMCVPIGRYENDWDREDLLHYEEELVSAVVEAAAGLAGSVALVDCGADIGTLSVLLAMKTGKLAKVFAVEPNKDVFDVLALNLSGLPVPGEAIWAAVADFNGRGRFGAPEHDRSSDHARFLVPDPKGAFPVTRIDDLPLRDFDSIIVKIDVEGGEAAAIAGAAETIARAEGVVITLEAHPEQVRRTGIDPASILRTLASIRPFEFGLCEDATARVDPERDFFAQFDSKRIHNILCRSAPSQEARNSPGLRPGPHGAAGPTPKPAPPAPAAQRAANRAQLTSSESQT